MVERKPAGASWESWIDRQIREAQERGEFDDLPGAGKPLPDLDRQGDELWWIRKKLKAEKLSYLPPVLEVRKERQDALERIEQARSEPEVRRIVAEINERIRQVNRSVLDGPASTLMPLDEEGTVRRWHAARESEDER